MLTDLPADQWERREQPVALFTQRLCIIAKRKARLYAASVCSHWTKQLKDALVCHFIQHAGIVNQTRSDSAHHDNDIFVFFLIVFCFHLLI